MNCGVKTRCGIPYGARLDYADIHVDAELDGEVGVVGRATARYKGNVFPPQHLELWRYYYSWWAYTFEFGLDPSGSHAGAHDQSIEMGHTGRCMASEREDRQGILQRARLHGGRLLWWSSDLKRRGIMQPPASPVTLARVIQ